MTWRTAQMHLVPTQGFEEHITLIRRSGNRVRFIIAHMDNVAQIRAEWAASFFALNPGKVIEFTAPPSARPNRKH